MKQARLLEERELLREQHEREMEEKCFKGVLQWKADQEHIWARAQEGSEPDNPWPHPNDFILDHHKYKWTIRGPVDSSDVWMFKRRRYQRDYRLNALVIEIRSDQDRLAIAAHQTWTVFNNLLPMRWQIEPSDIDRVFVEPLAMPIDRLRAYAETAKRQAELLPEPQLDKKTQRETYRIVNKAMQPLLKLKGFRSLAELERECDNLEHQYGE